MIKFKHLILMAAGLILQGCSMVQSDYVTAPATVRDCARDSVAYHLPLRRIQVTVTNYRDAKPEKNVLEINGITSATDNRWTFCLERLNNFFAVDQIGVEVEDGLLKRVFTQAEDKSLLILERTAETVFQGIAGATSGRSFDAAQTIADKRIYGPYNADPFNYEEMRALNETLEPLGFCLQLDPRDDPYVPDWSPQLCQIASVPDRTPKERRLQALGAKAVLPPKPWGVLYRPLLSHRLLVMQRPDPALKTAWNPVQSKFLQIPNAAPIFGVAVERAAFTKRKTQIKFDKGVLQDVQIDKGSELNELATLPITLAQLVVSLPAEIIRLRIANTTSQAQLVEAQQNLLNSLMALEEAEKLRGATDDEIEQNENSGRTLSGDDEDFIRIACRDQVPSLGGDENDCLDAVLDGCDDPNQCLAAYLRALQATQ